MVATATVSGATILTKRGNNMTEKQRFLLRKTMAVQQDLPIEACDDIIDECITQITELESGESSYKSVEQIIVDYLQLPASWARLFVE